MFLKEYFGKMILKKKSTDYKNMKKYQAGNEFDVNVLDVYTKYTDGHAKFSINYSEEI